MIEADRADSGVPRDGFAPPATRLPWHRRLQVRILLVTILAIVAIELIILVPTTVHFRQELRGEFFDEAASQAWRAAPAVIHELETERPDLSRGDFSLRSDRAMSAIYDRHGKLVWMSRVGAPWPDELVRQQIALHAESPLIEGQVDTDCFVILPLRDASGAHLGAIATVKSAMRLRAETVRYVMRILGLVLLICLFTGLIVMWFLYRDIVLPVERIVEANKAVSSGDPSASSIDPAQMPPHELGTIMQTRNQMLERLGHAREQIVATNQQLEDWNRTLEQRVAERTAALEQSRERAAQAEKLAAIGKLAASVAHEINNPLGIIGASSENLKREIDAGEGPSCKETTVGRSVEIIQSQVGRCKSIIDSLMSFSRRANAEPEFTDVGELLAETAQLVEGRAAQQAKRVSVEVERPIRTTLLRTHLQQALVNLLENALDASEPGQMVVLGAGHRGKDLLIEVRDSGQGMTEQVRERIFDPFFTTKPAGAGAGMGLTIAADFVRAHAGHIEVESTPGEGSRFKILIPDGHPDPLVGA